MNEPIDVRDHSGEEGLEGVVDIVCGLFGLLIVLPVSAIYRRWVKLHG